jgi:hypothetical protein
MVYLLYTTNNGFNGYVYDGEDEARDFCSMYGNGWHIVSLPYFKKESSTFHYSEEDPEYDETHYLELQQKNNDLKENLKKEQKKFKILEEFTNFFILLLVLSIVYSVFLLIMLIHKY